MQPAPRIGIVCALASAVLFGVTMPLAKVMLGGIPPWLLAGLLYLGTGLGLGAVRLWRVRRGRSSEAPLRKADLGWLAAVVLFGGILGPVLLMYGLIHSTAATASMLLNLEGLATLAIAWMVYREPVELRLALGALAILSGAALLSWQGGPQGFGLGALAVAGACLCWGIDNNLTRKLSSADPVAIASIKGMGAGAVNTALALAFGHALPAWPLAAGALLVGLAGYGVSLVLFIYALRHLGAARTGAYFALAPFVGAVVAVVALGEAATWQLAIAGLLMAAGLHLHLAERHDHDHRHDAVEHEHAHRHDLHHQHDHGSGDPSGEPHVHRHRHAPMVHRHPHYPDIHHRHSH
jgi:drug/metabolite transporter (DMT)-like permease